MRSQLTSSSKLLAFRVSSLIRHPIFGVLTLFGNGIIALSAYVFFLLEHPTNPKVKTYFDGLWWAVTTCTTVGDGDILPTTPMGRILGITMMIFGTALFCSFTALFSAVLMGSQIDELKTEVTEDEIVVEELIEKLETTLKALNHHQKTKSKTPR